MKNSINFRKENVGNLIKITKEDFMNLIKNPMWVFYVTGFPLLMCLIVGYLTKNLYGKQFTSYDYYGITMMIYAFTFSGMTSANAFMEERIKKPNMRIIYAPGSVSNIFLSKILASFIFVFVFHLFDLAFLHYVVGVRMGHFGMLIFLFGMTDLFFIILGIMVCCLVKSEMMSNQIQSIIVTIAALLGGLLFSLEGFGKVVRMISRISPLKWIVEASFQTIYSTKAPAFWPSILFLGISEIMMLFVCYRKFKKEDCIC